jgi:hypothetical protein
MTSSWSKSIPQRLGAGDCIDRVALDGRQDAGGSGRPVGHSIGPVCGGVSPPRDMDHDFEGLKPRA